MTVDVARSTVIAAVVVTTAAQAASTMGAAVFPVIAPRLAAEVGVAPATIGYRISHGALSLVALLGTVFLTLSASAARRARA